MKQFFCDFWGILRFSLKKNRSKAALRVCFLKYTVSSFAAILYREAKALKEKGFDVDIVCLRSFPEEKIFQRFDGLNMYRIQSRPSREKSALKYFFQLALFFFKSTLFLTLSSFRKKYDLIHVTNPPDIFVFAAIIPKLLGAKIILDIYDISPELFMRKLHVPEDKIIIKIMKLFEKISVRFADLVITVHEIWKQKLVSRSVPPWKCMVVLNSPDVDIFRSLDADRPRPSNGFNLYYHGSLEEHFGIDTMLKAMPIIKRHIPGASLHIYGKGRDVDAYKSLMTKLKIDNYVNFNDVVPFYDLPGILADADVGIVPTKGSVFADEALSMKALEYLTLGIPIVISKTTVHAYYYNDDMVMFFRPDNHEDLARCAIDIFNNPDKRKQLLAGSQQFMRKHNWRVYKKKYYDAIEQILHI